MKKETLVKHIEEEKIEVAKNMEKTKDHAENLEKAAKENVKVKGKSPRDFVQDNIDNINALAKDVYNLSFNCDMMNSLSCLGLTQTPIDFTKQSKNASETNSKIMEAIARFIGCSRKYWEPIKKCLDNHFSDKNHYTLEQMSKAGTLGNLIGENHPLYECWKELFYTNAQGIGNGELLLSLLLRGGSLQHTGSGDVTFYPKSTSKDKLGVPVAVEVKAGNSQLPFDLTSENTSKAVARIDALIEGIKKYGEINVNEKKDCDRIIRNLIAVKNPTGTPFGGKYEFFNGEKKIDVFLMFTPTASGDDIAITVFSDKTPSAKIAEKLRFEIPDVSNKLTKNNYIVQNIREGSRGKKPSAIKTSFGLERGWFCGKKGLNLPPGTVLDVSQLRPQNKISKTSKNDLTK